VTLLSYFLRTNQLMKLSAKTPQKLTEIDGTVMERRHLRICFRLFIFSTVGLPLTTTIRAFFSAHSRSNSGENPRIFYRRQEHKSISCLFNKPIYASGRTVFPQCDVYCETVSSQLISINRAQNTRKAEAVSHKE
jgi:hypothetical protein